MAQVTFKDVIELESTLGELMEKTTMPVDEIVKHRKVIAEWIERLSDLQGGLDILILEQSGVPQAKSRAFAGLN